VQKHSLLERKSAQHLSRLSASAGRGIPRRGHGQWLRGEIRCVAAIYGGCRLPKQCAFS
jgi:hypothetical protein